jgi:hypothetical protein
MTNRTITKKITNSGTRGLVNKLLPSLEQKYRIREGAQDSIFYDWYQSYDIKDQYTSRFNIEYIKNCLIGWNTVANQINNLQFFSFQRSKRWAQTSTSDIKTSIDEIIGLSYANSIAKKYIWEVFNCEPELRRDTEEELELDVIRKYMLIPQVMLIYTDEYQERKRFLIFTSNNKYDDSLMEILLSNEYEIRVAFASIPASFEYIPRLADVTNEIVPQDAKLIYKRGYDVFLTSSYMAGWSQREVSKASIR